MLWFSSSTRRYPGVQRAARFEQNLFSRPSIFNYLVAHHNLNKQNLFSHHQIETIASPSGFPANRNLTNDKSENDNFN
jgi:hypothetical protein